WAKDQLVHFTIEFSEPIIQTKFHSDKSKAGFLFVMKNKNPLKVKVALSFTNQAGANENLKTELPGWNFDSTAMFAKQAWELELSKIKVENTDTNQKTIFYSALYHCMIHPNIASDVNGNYMGMDHQIHKAIGYQRYTVFSLWDTYRGLHPLLSIIDRKRTRDFIVTFLEQYKEHGRLPVWELASNETDCMIGYHAASVICDAWSKGIRDFDSSLALKAMTSIANENKLGKRDYIKNGFLSSENEPESVSKTLEYAYDDWCISQFAAQIGNTAVADIYSRRSNAWRNLLDPKTGFMRPRFNGNWLEPFEPREVNNHFTEANCWQYSFYVPHDIRSHMEALGGPENMLSKLDQLFTENSATTGREQADITGLIGQYAHGNEPSHHIAYLYNYLFEPSKTQEKVHQICSEFYLNSPDGLIGNEDCGQMSAWYVLSAMGFYQVTPGLPWFTIGTPSLDKAIVHLENGKSFQIIAPKRNPQNYYGTARLNGEIAGFIDYESIINGGKLEFQLSNLPTKDAADYLMLPFPKSEFQNPIPPNIKVERTFRGNTMVEITSEGDNIYYYLNNDSVNFQFYKRAFEVRNSCSIHAYAVKYKDVSTLKSPVSTAFCHKIPNIYSATTLTSYNSQYTAGGPNGLVDGIKGNVNWRAGDWQGYQNCDLNVVIDLGKSQEITAVNCGFLQDQGSWIFYPTQLDVLLSVDGKTWVEAGVVKVEPTGQKFDTERKEIVVKLKSKRTSQFVKIIAHNYGALPNWHPGAAAQGQAFIFVDEIEIK
ncbi:MAG: GH92 family glycosyl hydrolase, partial [Bacteroidia bacterium]|nr:GH92 family glycosyl hydrolase [Bacteroidia bacterium]